MPLEQICPNPSCFFCIMKEPSRLERRGKLRDYVKAMRFLDDQELILVVSGIWNIAMKSPDDEELPLLGIFEFLAGLISKAVHDRAWLLSNQNVYIPYYAAHIIGSYTIKKVDLAVRAIESGVIPPLLELLRGKISWVEKRVAVRALGHIASYDKTFKALAVYEDEVVKLAMHTASTCLKQVYETYVGIKDRRKRVKYYSDLLTRGAGGVEMENTKAEEWAIQLQCWSIHLLNCFAAKERGLHLMCNQQFLEDLSKMWGGLLMNHTAPAGIGLIRILCYNKVGRVTISKSVHMIENLCKLSRSCDDWQYMGIDCLLLLLKDPDTRYTTIQVASLYLVDLIELRSLGSRNNVGDSITQALLMCDDYSKVKNFCHDAVQRAIETTWDIKIVRRQKERVMSDANLEDKKSLVRLIKQEGNRQLLMGDTEKALIKYTQALEICPLRYRNQRIALYSSRARCHLLLRDADSVISDTTRALCLSSPPNSHAVSLWTRSQAYDMKKMARESLMDCIMFINVYLKFKTGDDRMKLPYYVVHIINKQMDSTWIFRDVQINATKCQPAGTNIHKSRTLFKTAEKMRIQVQNGNNISGLPTIFEETLPGQKAMEGKSWKVVKKAD